MFITIFEQFAELFLKLFALKFLTQKFTIKDLLTPKEKLLWTILFWVKVFLDSSIINKSQINAKWRFNLFIDLSTFGDSQSLIKYVKDVTTLQPFMP